MESRYMFKVLINDERVIWPTGSNIPGTLKAAKAWVREHVLSTHMGEWRRIPGGYEYATTIGRYYQFIRLTPDEHTK